MEEDDKLTVSEKLEESYIEDKHDEEEPVDENIIEDNYLNEDEDGEPMVESINDQSGLKLNTQDNRLSNGTGPVQSSRYYKDPNTTDKPNPYQNNSQLGSFVHSVIGTSAK